MNIEKIIDTNEERQVFIEWAARNHYDVSEIPTFHGVLFKRQSTTDAWMGWLYSAKAKAEKLEGCVVVPVNNTTIVAVEKMVEQQVEASGITADVFRLDGEKILNAAVEAARGGNE